MYTFEDDLFTNNSFGFLKGFFEDGAVFFEGFDSGNRQEKTHDPKLGPMGLREVWSEIRVFSSRLSYHQILMDLLGMHSNRKGNWALKEGPERLFRGFVGDEMLPSYVGIIIREESHFCLAPAKWSDFPSEMTFHALSHRESHFCLVPAAKWNTCQVK